MWCMKCGNHLSKCTCPDLKERLESLKKMPHVLSEWCDKCKQHHSQCTCPKPLPTLYNDNKVVAQTVEVPRWRKDEK